MVEMGESAETAQDHSAEDERAAVLADLRGQLKEARELNDAMRQAELLSEIARVLWELRHVKEAVHSALESLRLFKGTGNELGQARTLCQVGEMLLERGQIIQPQRLFETSMGIYERAEDERGQARVLRNMGRVAEAQGDWSGALMKFMKALIKHRTLGMRKQQAIDMRHIGLVFCQRGLDEQGLSTLMDAAELQKSLNDQHELTETLRLIDQMKAQTDVLN